LVEEKEIEKLKDRIIEEIDEIINKEHDPKSREEVISLLYYYLVGYVGRYIKSLVREEVRKKPRWLKQIEKKIYCKDDPLTWCFATYLANLEKIKVDHTFYHKDGYFVSEPYNMHMGDFERLIHFCKEFNLDFMVVGESRHLPGHTFRVLLFPQI